MARFLRPQAGWLLGAALAAACVPPTAWEDAGPTASLRPRSTSTAVPPSPTPRPTLPATAEPGPTPTPFKHVVRQGDTLLRIAGLYGVSLDALLAVNPGINPTVLSIGQELLIPDPEGGPIIALVPSPTPIPLALSGPTCYRRPTAGLWCLAGVHNPSGVDLENLVVEIRLHREDGELVVSESVSPPLNLLPAGRLLPVAASFSEAPLSDVAASALVLTVLPAAELETRFRAPEVVVSHDQRQEGGQSWLIRGTVSLPPDSPTSNRTRLLATALSDRGEVAGFAVWEPDSPIGPGETRSFSMRIFSLGPPLARFELLAEMFAVVEEAE